jgi:hypothetical protein
VNTVIASSFADGKFGNASRASFLSAENVLVLRRHLRGGHSAKRCAAIAATRVEIVISTAHYISSAGYAAIPETIGNSARQELQSGASR